MIGLVAVAHLIAWILAKTDQFSYWLPPKAATTSEPVDYVFYFILWISVFFFVLIVALMLIFVFRYRRRDADKPAGEVPKSHLGLELTWTFIPIVVVVVIFYLGFQGFMELSTPPGDALEILVTGQKWSWLFSYPNGYVDSELHVPYDTPVQLVMTSEDVVHSFYVPAFRVKRDLLPGRYTKAWFQATKTGEFPIYCAEYCGTEHSAMVSTVIVHEPGGYESWLERASNFLDTMAPADAGRRLHNARGCAQCHSIDGSAGIGPSLKGIYNHQAPMRDGTTLVADENYLRDSIVNPQAKIVAGYEPVMPTYKGRLSDKEITALIEFIKSLDQE